MTPAQRDMCRRESGAPTAQAMSMAMSPQRVSSRHRSCSACIGIRKPTAWSVSLLQPRNETSSRRVHRRSSRSAWQGGQRKCDSHG